MSGKMEAISAPDRRRSRRADGRWNVVVPDGPTLGGGPIEMCLPMRARIGGLTRFGIVGTLLDQVVFACWDGAYLTLSGALWNIVSSSSKCFETSDDGLLCSGDPRRIALQLVQVLSDLASIQYSVWCDRLQTSRSWRFEGTASNELVGGLIA
jgi:hypothetical protein